MLIRVRLFGELKEYFKKSRTTIEIPQGSSINDLFFNLSKKRNSILFKELVEKEDLRKIKILVNGRDITHLRNLETKLNNQDLITLLPIAGGG
jgi:MoaD family protein